MASVEGNQAIEGVEGALTAWVAAQCERPLGQELSSVDEQRFVKEVEAAKCRGLDAWCKFQVFSPVPQTKVTKDVVETRWVLTWKALEGKRTLKARLVSRGFKDPDLAEGLADTSSCVSLRSSHLQVISLSALKKWKLWCLVMWKLRRNGNCEKMPSCRLISFLERFFFKLRRNGVRVTRIGRGV